MKYYRRDLPNEDEYVFVKLKKVTKHNFAVVELLEYDNAEGMILFSEIHHRKINIEKLFKNNIHICVVTNVDTEKNYVNLSYKKVLVEDRDFYGNARIELDKLINIFRDMQALHDDHTHSKTHIIYEKIMWNIFDDQISKKNLFANLGDIYKNILENPAQIFENIDIPNDYKIMCSENIKSRVRYTDMQGALYFDLLVLDTNAVDLIKKIMSADGNWEYECVSSPKYRITATSNDKDEMDKIMGHAKSVLQNKLNNINSIFKIDDVWTVIKDKTCTIKPLFICHSA